MALQQPHAQLWERISGESVKNYEAFCRYRDMGPSRSLEKVARELTKSKQLLNRWATLYHWSERAKAWDNEQDRLTRESYTKDILDMRRRHAQIAKEVLDKVRDAFQLLDAAELKATELARLLNVASKLERVSRGDAGEIMETREQVEEPIVQFYIPDNGREAYSS